MVHQHPQNQTYHGDDPEEEGPATRTGEDITIGDFARMVADVVGYEGNIVFDTSRPDGTPRKLLDVSKLAALGWRARTPLREGLTAAYADFIGDRSSNRDPRIASRSNVTRA